MGNTGEGEPKQNAENKEFLVAFPVRDTFFYKLVINTLNNDGHGNYRKMDLNAATEETQKEIAWYAATRHDRNTFYGVVGELSRKYPSFTQTGTLHPRTQVVFEAQISRTARSIKGV